MPKQILIIGYLGFENFGDEALLHVLIKDLIKVGFKREHITAISNAPAKTISTHQVNSVNRWNLLEIVIDLLACDNVIFIGGLFQDKTSLRSFIYYFLLLYVAKALRKKIVFYGVGVGPFLRNISLKLFNLGVSNLELLTVRDNTSSNNFFDRTNVIVSCDPLWSIEPDYIFQNETASIKWDIPIVGVCLRSNKNFKGHRISEIADKLSRIITGMKDWQVLLIPSMPNEDLPVLYELYDLLSAKVGSTERITLLENFNRFPITQQAGILASCDVMVSMRYHALLVPLANGKPVFGIICDQKIKSLLDFAKQIGVSPKDDIDPPWNYFWQDLEKAQDFARTAKEKTGELHKRNIEILERLYGT